MKIELWSIDKLIPYPRNARTIPQVAIDKVAASIQEFGWQQPIVVDSERVIIVGHVRLLAAKQIGCTEVPVLVAVDLTPEQVRAYRLMDNRSHEEAGWDFSLLGPELMELKALGTDLTLTGFTDEQIAEFLAGGAGGASNPVTPEAARQTLAERFGVPPFSVLDARQGYWQERKRAWLALGIQSELGRGEGTLKHHGPTVTQNPDGTLDYRGSNRKEWNEKQGPAANSIPGGKANATPGGSKMPAADYSKSKARGNGKGRAVPAA